MAEEWSEDGICINAIGPGFFPTELTKAVFDDAERAERNAMQTCIGRNGKLEDIDGPLLFLSALGLPIYRRDANDRFKFSEIWDEFFAGLMPPTILISFALGSILLGFATPAEAAAMGAFGYH